MRAVAVHNRNSSRAAVAFDAASTRSMLDAAARRYTAGSPLAPRFAAAAADAVASSHTAWMVGEMPLLKTVARPEPAWAAGVAGHLNVAPAW